MLSGVIITVLIFALIVVLIWRAISLDIAYWRGRQEGWKACEHMVMDRAKGNSKYDHIWEDLIQ